MSIKIMSEVWESGPENRGHLLVMLALADYANSNAECWPSIKSIANKARMTERGVQKIIRTLEAEKWLDIDTGNGRGGCNKYKINPERGFTPNVVHPEQMNTKPRTDEHETLNGGSPEPLEPSEPSLEDNARTKPDVDSKQNDKPPPKARLPEDWALSDEDLEYAYSLKLNDAEIEEIANDFHTYWADRTDAGGRKSARGWRQTWRNRVRDQAPRFIRNRGMAGKQGPGGYGQSGSIASIVARRHARG